VSRTARRGRAPSKEGGPFANRLFRRLFLSYVSIVAAAFLCYSAFVLSEGAVRSRADAERHGRAKLEELSTFFESQLLEARNAASRIKSSIAIRDYYMGLRYAVRSEGLVQPYQCIQELKSARSAANTIGIYDVLLFISGDDRVYSSADIIVLNDPFFARLGSGPTVVYGRLADELGLGEAKDLRLGKDYLIYGEDYSYDGTVARGRIEVLFDVQSVEALLSNLREPGMAFAVSSGGTTIFGSSTPNGKPLTKDSIVAKGVTYELTMGRASPWPALAAMTLAALLVGAIAAGVFLLGAYLFSRSYYRPIGKISRLVEGEAGGAEGLDDIADGISSILDEREGYKRAASASRPFVKQAALHAILNGDLDEDEIGFLARDSGLALDRRFFLAAVANVALRDGAAASAEGLKPGRRLVVKVAEELSRGGLEVTYYDKDAANLVLLISSDEAEEPMRLLEAMHERVSELSTDSPFVVTIGANEAGEGIVSIPRSYGNATAALDDVLLEGRGRLLLYRPRPGSRGEDCYFPSDAQLRIMRALGSGDMESVGALLDEIYERNSALNARGGQGTRLVLYELYVATARAFGRLGLLSEMSPSIDDAISPTTLEEVIARYKRLYAEAWARLSESQDSSRIDEEIVAYVTSNCFDQGIALKNVSERYGVGMKRVSAIFQQRFSMSYARYVHSRRIAKAIELLKDPTISLESVGSSCGYASNLTFRRHFQRELGVNPSDYRKELEAG
jgi:AraC-type DNA-binding domain-containing proteins